MIFYEEINPFLCFFKIPCILITIIIFIIGFYIEENSVIEPYYIAFVWSWLFQCFSYTFFCLEDL